MDTIESKKILLLGGTGVIGVNLASQLIQQGFSVYVTTRQSKTSDSINLTYIKGDAKSQTFLSEILNNVSFDAIVDFMHYSTEDFVSRLPVLLNKNRQYIYLSSYRVYANSKYPIVEESDYLVDKIDNSEYFESKEYAIQKTEQERILKQNTSDFWTIVRPSVTYGDKRFQLGGFESDIILPRAANNLPLALPAEILDRKATMTSGKDVAKMILGLLFNKKAYQNDYNTLSSETVTWREIASIYKECIELDVKEVTLEEFFLIEGNIWQIKFDRMYDRICDNSKVLKDINLSQTDFQSVEEGLKSSLSKLNISHFSNKSRTISRKNGHIDRVLGIKRFPLCKNFKLLALYYIGKIRSLDEVYNKLTK